MLERENERRKISGLLALKKRENAGETTRKKISP